MKTKFSPRLIVTAVAVSLGLAASAFAMPPKAEGPAGSGAPKYERHMANGFKEMTRLHDDLKLDAKQEVLWQEAVKTGKDSMGDMRDQRRKQHEETMAMLNQPGADLRVVLKRMDDFRAEGQKRHEASRDRWLAVYDAFNPEQKEKARVFFKSKMERMGKTGARAPHGRRDAGRDAQK